MTNPTHVYAASLAVQALPITLTVANAAGSVSTTSQISIVNVPPTVTTGPVQVVHAGATVQFNAAGAGPGGSATIASIEWDFN